VNAFYRWHNDDLILQVSLQPNAREDAIVGPVGGSLKIKVNAAPIEGKANKRLIEFLAKEFGVSRSAVVLESGHTSKSKRLRIKAPAKMPTGVALNQTLF
jgi:uncharacterized protein (TIGR00251 family)